MYRARDKIDGKILGMWKTAINQQEQLNVILILICPPQW